MNLGTFLTGTLLDSRVLLLQPLLYGFRTLLIRAFDGLLWGEAPASQVFAYAAHLQPDAKFLFNELTHCSTAPQAELHLELLGTLVDD